MVKLTAGATQWSGVMIDPSGRIVTTSLNLGAAPLVSFRTHDGATGQAWVVGRDDNLDLAILEVVNPGQQFPFAEVSSEDVPVRSEDLVLMHFRPTSTTLAQSASNVVGSRQDPTTGISYIQVGGFSLGTEAGGAVFDARGRLRGLRMDSDRMIEIGIGRVGEAWAMDSFTLSSALIPRLEAGFTVINASSGRCADEGSFPPVPAIYSGSITIGGAPAAADSRLYVRALKTSTGEEVWFSQLVAGTGEYFITISICDISFGPASPGAPARSIVQFWLNATSTGIPSIYIPGDFYSIDLAFP
jgi:hypothetical protein